MKNYNFVKLAEKYQMTPEKEAADNSNYIVIKERKTGKTGILSPGKVMKAFIGNDDGSDDRVVTENEVNTEFEITGVTDYYGNDYNILDIMKSEVRKIYMLVETYQYEPGLKEFEVIAASEDIDLIKSIMAEKVKDDFYNLFKNGVEFKAEDGTYICSKQVGGTKVEYSIICNEILEG